MLDIAVRYRDTLDSLCSKQERGLRAFELSAEEWTIAEELRDVLKDATLFFSRDTPNLAMVIPAMDHIDTMLTNHCRDDGTLDPAIRSALRLSKKTLNRYYKISDMSTTYRIAMVLHPGHKLKYFEQAGWPSGWRKTAEQIVRKEYDTSY
ncbi:uncharacterized protein TRAVEDRAFT_123695, partial [Trametes versicolor FP-101664 SS1]|uniref:uncharacterized protein n=1 Tax=Trametes versicolor (strain FP-101664) TaxID=717944 RepID=UPI0004624279